MEWPEEEPDHHEERAPRLREETMEGVGLTAQDCGSGGTRWDFQALLGISTDPGASKHTD